MRKSVKNQNSYIVLIYLWSIAHYIIQVIHSKIKNRPKTTNKFRHKQPSFNFFFYTIWKKVSTTSSKRIDKHPSFSLVRSVTQWTGHNCINRRVYELRLRRGSGLAINTAFILFASNVGGSTGVGRWAVGGFGTPFSGPPKWATWPTFEPRSSYWHKSPVPNLIEGCLFAKLDIMCVCVYVCPIGRKNPCM